jgi:hypothetical protein
MKMIQLGISWSKGRRWMSSQERCYRERLNIRGRSKDDGMNRRDTFRTIKVGLRVNVLIDQTGSAIGLKHMKQIY